MVIVIPTTILKLHESPHYYLLFVKIQGAIEWRLRWYIPKINLPELIPKMEKYPIFPLSTQKFNQTGGKILFFLINLFIILCHLRARS